MKFFDLVNISERNMELVNPSSPEKVILFGERLSLKPGMRLIDFGCGYAEPLVLWAEHFGIEGVGIDIREYACERARKKIGKKGLSGRLEIVCGNAAEYEYQPGSFDVAVCLGATFIWDDFAGTIAALKNAVRPGGQLGIGEPFWLQDSIPPAYLDKEQPFQSESELFETARAAGYVFSGIVRASHEDWDRYESDNWQGLLAWLEENPDHPEREDVRRHLLRIQQEYLQYSRKYLGWGMFALAPLE